MNLIPGRTCPTAYYYGASALAKAQTTRVETLYAVGGLYGNPFALAAVQAMAEVEMEPVTICFNGDFNWFNVDDESFLTVNETVLRHQAIRGNVEFEFSGDESLAGCGCSYPEAVNQDFVDRSNRIHSRLKITAKKYPEIIARLASLPLFARYEIGEMKIGVVHGDADSLAGWLFDTTKLGESESENKIAAAFGEANVDIFAGAHTCLPALRRFTLTQGQGIVANNGAAGMPNFRGVRSGLLTRISVHASPHKPLYGDRLGHIFIDALPIEYDDARWRAHFLSNWPAGSDAHTSYFARIADGPEYSMTEALHERDSPFCR